MSYKKGAQKCAWNFFEKNYKKLLQKKQMFNILNVNKKIKNDRKKLKNMIVYILEVKYKNGKYNKFNN